MMKKGQKQVKKGGIKGHEKTHFLASKLYPHIGNIGLPPTYIRQTLVFTYMFT